MYNMYSVRRAVSLMVVTITTLHVYIQYQSNSAINRLLIIN